MMDKLRRALLPILVFAKIDTKRLFRDKMAIFFTFLFPLIFLFIFGGIFGRSSDVSFNVALINQSDSTFSQDFVKQAKDDKVLKINADITTIDQAKEAMSNSRIDAAIILPQSFGDVQAGQQYPSGQAKVLYAKNNEQSGQTLTSVLQGVFKGINKGLVGEAPQPFTVVSESTGKAGLSNFDYLFAGLIGFAILGMGLFGPTNVFPRLKQRGVLRRYHTTSLRVWQFVLGNILSNSVAALLSVAFMITVALTVPFFDAHLQGNLIELTLFIILGAVVIFGIGLTIGGWAKNENQAAPLSNLVSFPMMFLSGTFFPRFLMPEWLQTASGFLPLTPFIDGVRMIMVEGKHLIDIMPQIGMLAIWGVVIYIIAFKVFRWE
ncbi:MAG: ABC transporter permease [Candidatus Saccharimonas sp.]